MENEYLSIHCRCFRKGATFGLWRWLVLNGKGESIRNGLDRTLQGAVSLNSTQHCILEWTAVALRLQQKPDRSLCNVLCQTGGTDPAVEDGAAYRVHMTDPNMLRSRLNHVLYWSKI
jgi:hypothetical protein